MRQWKRWSSVLLAGVLVLPVVPVVRTASGSEPKPAESSAKGADLEQEVRRLIADLSADRRELRVTAEKRLLELGPKVLPHLPPPELLPTVSVRETVRHVRFELERRAARESSRAATVTLQGTKPVAGWFAEMARQSGNRIDPGKLSDRLKTQPLELQLSEAEFWPALDETTRKAGLSFRFDDTPGTITIVPLEESLAEEAAVAYSGAFRVGVVSAETRKKAGQERPGLLRVQFSLAAEPRLRPLFLQYAAADIIASAGDKTLPPFNPDARYEVPLGEGRRRATFQQDFELPDQTRPDAIRLRGKIAATTAADSAPIRFTDLDKALDPKFTPVARRRGGVTVTLHRVIRERTADGKPEFRVRVTVAYDTGGPAFESHRTWILHNEVFLENKQGERFLLNGGYDTTLQADGAVGMEYRFVSLPRPVADYSFVYVAPTLIVDVPVEFDLKSVRLAE